MAKKRQPKKPLKKPAAAKKQTSSKPSKKNKPLTKLDRYLDARLKQHNLDQDVRHLEIGLMAVGEVLTNIRSRKGYELEEVSHLQDVKNLIKTRAAQKKAEANRYKQFERLPEVDQERLGAPDRKQYEDYIQSLKR